MKMNTQEMLRLFTELVTLDSPSFEERKVYERLLKELKELGCEISTDRVGEKLAKEHGITNSENACGNIFATLKGELPGEPLLFSSHMDTVEPSRGKRAILQEDGKITSDGTTVLGADDMVGLTAILSALRTLKTQKIPHRSVELLFPVAEEQYTLGSKRFDYSKITAKDAYVLDMSGDTGTAAYRAPSLLSFCVTVRGRASHAGFAPERGINALAIGAKAVSELAQGRTDDETTLNIGTMQGGIASNVIADECVCRGEIRSYNHETALALVKQVEETFREAAEKFPAENGDTAEVEFAYETHLHAHATDFDTTTVLRFQNACRRLGLAGSLRSTFGGSDNDSFAENGICGIVLSCGIYRAHSTDEYTTVEELRKITELTAELMTSTE